MWTILRAPAILLIALAPAVSACGGHATSPVPAQPHVTAASAALRCRTLDFAEDSSANQLNGIDNAREIAGTGTPAGGYVIRPPYRQADYRPVNYPGAVATSVTGISDTRVIVGFYSDRSGDTIGFIEAGGVWTIVKSPSNLLELLGVSKSSIVGFYDRHRIDHGFEMIPSHRIRPPGGISDVAAGVNDRGHIVGYMTVAGGGIESFLRDRRVYTEFFYPGSTNTMALGINDRDEVVGSYVDSAGATHGFLLTQIRTNPHWQSFDEPQAYGFTRLSGINDRSELVGSYRDASGVMHGFFCLP